MMLRLQNDIAGAIKKADSTYFFEDYTKQALAVLLTLEKGGYTIIPKKPTDAMLEAGADAILPGKVRPEEHVKYVYSSMLKAAEKNQ